MSDKLAKRGEGGAQGRELVLSPGVAQQATEAIRHARADGTWRAYEADWRGFIGWCSERAQPPRALPASPETLIEYILHLARREGRKTSTIMRKLSAISVRHRPLGKDNPTQHPTVREVLLGIRKENVAARQGVDQALPIEAPMLVRVVGALSPTSMQGLRDRALMLLGYAIAAREDSLVGIDLADLKWLPDRLDVTLQREKTRGTGEARVIAAVPWRQALCPLVATQTWIASAGIAAGPLFRRVSRGGVVGSARLDAEGVALIVRRAVRAAGIDSTGYSGHSLRAGHVTQAIRGGATLAEVMKVTGHKRPETLMRYVRNIDTVHGSSASKIIPKF